MRKESTTSQKILVEGFLKSKGLKMF